MSKEPHTHKHTHVSQHMELTHICILKRKKYKRRWQGKRKSVGTELEPRNAAGS